MLRALDVHICDEMAWKTRLPRTRYRAARALVDGGRFHDLGRHRCRVGGLHRQLGNQRRRGSHFLWQMRGVPISARGRPRGRQGWQQRVPMAGLPPGLVGKRLDPAAGTWKLGWAGRGLVLPRRASDRRLRSCHGPERLLRALCWRTSSQAVGDRQRTARGGRCW